MTSEEFDELVKRLQGEAHANPQRYKLRVLFLALLGYGYIALVFIVLLALVFFVVGSVIKSGSGALALKLVVPLVVLMGYIVRSLWVKFSHPEGIALTHAEAQPLFDIASELKRRLKAPRMHSILLTDDFNAGVVQVPRLGFLGWHKNYLLVGMPLMQALSPEQFRGVLAHEFGHLSGSHGRFGAWMYRIRQTWVQLMTTLEEKQHWGSAVFRRFLNWYVPFFNAYTFVLARTHEYEADRSAADLVGSRKFAEALLSINVNGSFLESRFWPGVYKNANNQPQPTSSPFIEMAGAFRMDVQPETRSVWLAQAIERTTSSEDTHPSLSDRLAALGESPYEPDPVTETAAQHLLGSSESPLCVRLSDLWRTTIAAAWRERYRIAQEEQRRLGDLDEKSKKESLAVEEEWDRARFTEEYRDAESALPLYQRVLELDEKHAGASFAVGRLTLHDNSSGGIELIEQAMKLGPEYVIPGCQVIHDHLVSQGRKEQAESYRARAITHSEAYQAAGEERATLNITDEYIPHVLNEEQVQKLCEQLAATASVKQAFLVCKKVIHFPEIPLYVLGIEPSLSWDKSVQEEEAAAMSQKLAAEFTLPGEFFVLVFTEQHREFRKVLHDVPGSLIYQRGG